MRACIFSLYDKIMMHTSMPKYSLIFVFSYNLHNSIDKFKFHIHCEWRVIDSLAFKFT